MKTNEFISALRAEFAGTVTVLMTHIATRVVPASTMALFADRGRHRGTIRLPGPGTTT